MDEQKDQEESKDQFDWQLMQFFTKIIRTVFIGMFWMLINIFFGLYLGFGVPEESTPIRMTIFYGWFVLSLGAYIYFLWRVWRRKMPPP
jgi:hypothetical protein